MDNNLWANTGDFFGAQPEMPPRIDPQKVAMYMMANQDKFPAEKLMLVKEKLESLTDDKYMLLTTIELKNPTTLLIISILLGSLGVDRFMLGETGMGVLKLLTGGCCGVLTIIDWFTVMKKTKEQNFMKIMALM